MGFFAWLLLLMIALKFLEVIDWAWWQVILLPIGIGLLLDFIIITIFGVAVVSGDVIARRNTSRRRSRR